MSKLKYLVVIGASALLVGALTLSTFAATFKDPIDIVAELTGKTVDEIIVERYEEDKPLSVIAAEAGVYDEFRNEMQANREAVIEERVTEGELTREQADRILENGGRGYGYGSCHGLAGDGERFGEGYGRGGMMGRGRGY